MTIQVATILRSVLLVGTFLEVNIQSVQATPMVFNNLFCQLSSGVGQLGYTDAIGWRSSAEYDNRSLAVAFDPSTASLTGAPIVTSTDPTTTNISNLILYGPGNGIDNGLAPSPAGGNFIAFSGDPNRSAQIWQYVVGFTPGTKYTLSFWQAGAQTLGGNGASADSISAFLYSPGTFGLTVEKEFTLFNAAKSFTGWYAQFLSFVATGPEEDIFFQAGKASEGNSEFTLISGPTLSEDDQEVSPEPGSILLITFGISLISVLVRRQRSYTINS